MKFDKLIANPPYNVGNGNIYHKCINEMLCLTDRATVICPDGFKHFKEGNDKITYYDHKGMVWDGVRQDVAVFELDNNHNSPVCQTPDRTIKIHGIREEICQQLRERIGDRCLRDRYIKVKDLKGEWFYEVTITGRSVTDSIKNFILKNDNDYYGIESYPVPGRTFKVLKQSKNCAGIVKLTDAEYTGFINVISNAQFKLIFTELNTRVAWTIRKGSYIPIPSDLTDIRLLNDEYVTDLYTIGYEV